MQEFKKSNPEKLSRGPSGYNLYAQENKDKISPDRDKFAKGEFLAKMPDIVTGKQIGRAHV